MFIIYYNYVSIQFQVKIDRLVKTILEGAVLAFE